VACAPINYFVSRSCPLYIVLYAKPNSIFCLFTRLKTTDVTAAWISFVFSLNKRRLNQMLLVYMILNYLSINLNRHDFINWNLKLKSYSLR